MQGSIVVRTHEMMQVHPERRAPKKNVPNYQGFFFTTNKRGSQ